MFAGNNKPKPVPVEIKTSTLNNVSDNGRIAEGENIRPEPKTIQTESKLVFESKEIVTQSETANSAVLKWDQITPPAQTDSESHSTSYALVQFRTFNGKEWSDWVDAPSPEDRKDGTEAPHNALVLADVIKGIQYRFVLEGKAQQPSPEINLDSTSIELIDTTQGPSLNEQNKQSLLQKVHKYLGSGSTQAKSDSPYIYNRAQWGSPEPYNSPAWDPEYEPLHRVTIHHTATTFTPDSFAAMRSIWQFHTYTNGWGDIGYNYVVDSRGNMFQGRFYDYAEAARLKGEVVGAHAYEHNRGTSGIAVIGNFTSSDPSNDVFYSVARLAAFKAAPYDFNPAGSSWFGQHLIGHRDVNSTSCPGQKLYDRLQEVRNLASTYYPTYNSMEHLDTVYKGQGFNDIQRSQVLIWPGTTGTAFIDIQNNGTETWNNNGFGAIMLGTDAPRDRASLFCDSSWLGSNCDRPSTFKNKVLTDANGVRTLQPTNTIAPGEIARFQFQVRAPMQSQTYREQFHLLSANRTWFLRNRGIYFDFIVPPPFYAWEWQTQGIYTDQTTSVPVDINNVRAGQRVYFQLKGENTGNQPWLRDGPNPTRLATNRPQDKYSWLCDPTWVNSTHCNRAAALTETRVEPGQIGTFGFWGRIPYGGPGDAVLREYFNLTLESKAWLNDVGQYWEFTVRNP
ncbi:MAG: peptidoglycan recognition family protein [Patescibacteria group bacterium]